MGIYLKYLITIIKQTGIHMEKLEMLMLHMYYMGDLTSGELFSWWRHQMETFVRVTGHLCVEFTGPR